jgi:hypothetical protein
MRFPRLNILAAALMMACALTAGAISLDRQFFNVDTETDFVGVFLPDAERLTRGEPLSMNYHPPGYSIVLALVNRAVDDWMKSGLLISWLSMLFVLLASYALFRRVGGGWAALGGLVGLAVSDVFLTYSAQAASDIPFLALWMISLLLTASALDATDRWWWAVVGVVAGVGMLTRSNGIPMALLALAPFLGKERWSARGTKAATAAAGLAIPLCAWIWFASVTGSPITPTESYTNLALAYAEGRLSGDTLLVMKDRFASQWEVVAYDPLRLITTYLKNLVQLPRRLLAHPTWPPVAILGAAALPFWLLKIRDPRVSIVLATTLAGIVLTSVHPSFEARYYLFVVPLLGASAGHAVSLWLDRPSRRRFAPTAAIVGIVVVASVGLLLAAPRAYTKAEAPEVRRQLAEAVPAVRRHTPPEAIVFSRKDNLAFHAQRRTAMLPLVTTAEELCAPMQSQTYNGPIYIYIGWAERRRSRIDLAQELSRDELPSWLSIVAQGDAGGGWRLFAVKHAACG